MFTQKLTAWREKQRPETAWFQGKIQVEKSGGNLGHIYHVTPQQHLSPLAASSNKGGHFHCNHNVFTRFGRTQRTAPPLREQGGERGGEPRGARWGAGWRNAQRFTQHHRAGNLRWIRRIFSARNRIRHMKRVGRPGLPARPTSSAVCVRRQSSPLRLSQRRS